MIPKKIIKVKRELRERQSLEENKHNLEEQEFFKAILDLIDKMEADSASSYYEGKSDGMETMARILTGSEE